jgi:hypothetical protein
MGGSISRAVSDAADHMRTRLTLLTILLLTSLTASSQTVQLSDGGSARPWLAVGVTQVAVVWQQDQNRIQAAILDTLGNVVKPAFDVGSAPAAPVPPRASAVGDTFLVVWQDITSARDMNVRAAVIDRSGVLQPAFTIASTTSDLTEMAVVSDGTRYLVLWCDGTVSHAAWVNTTGVVESPFDVIANAFVTDAAAQNGTAVAVWYRIQLSTTTLDVGLTTLVGGASVASRVIASMPSQAGFGTPYLSDPAIAFNATGYYVAWHSGRTGRQDNIEGTRLTADLAPLDVIPSNSNGYQAGGTIVEGDYANGHKNQVHVSAVGDRFLLSWVHDVPVNDKLQSRYVDSDGKPSTYISFPVVLVPVPPYDSMGTGTTTVLPNGSPIATYTFGSGRLFVRYVGGGPRARVVRR